MSLKYLILIGLVISTHTFAKGIKIKSPQIEATIISKDIPLDSLAQTVIECTYKHIRSGNIVRSRKLIHTFIKLKNYERGLYKITLNKGTYWDFIANYEASKCYVGLMIFGRNHSRAFMGDFILAGSRYDELSAFELEQLTDKNKLRQDYLNYFKNFEIALGIDTNGNEVLTKI